MENISKELEETEHWKAWSSLSQKVKEPVDCPDLTVPWSEAILYKF